MTDEKPTTEEEKEPGTGETETTPKAVDPTKPEDDQARRGELAGLED